MLFGIQVTVIEDTKSRKLLIVKNREAAYLLQKNDEKWVHLLRMNVIHSVSIAFLVWYFAKIPVWSSVLIGTCIYLVVLFYFNKRVLPHLSVIKKYRVKTETNKTKNAFPVAAILYYLIAIALVICLFTDQVEPGYLTYIVYAAIIIAVAMGTIQFKTYIGKE